MKIPKVVTPAEAALVARAANVVAAQNERVTARWLAAFLDSKWKVMAKIHLPADEVTISVMGSPTRAGWLLHEQPTPSGGDRRWIVVSYKTFKRAQDRGKIVGKYLLVK